MKISTNLSHPVPLSSLHVSPTRKPAKNFRSSFSIFLRIRLEHKRLPRPSCHTFHATLRSLRGRAMCSPSSWTTTRKLRVSCSSGNSFDRLTTTWLKKWSHQTSLLRKYWRRLWSSFLMSISKEFWISINGTLNGKTLETLHMERLRNAFLTDKQVFLKRSNL